MCQWKWLLATNLIFPIFPNFLCFKLLLFDQETFLVWNSWGHTMQDMRMQRLCRNWIIATNSDFLIPIFCNPMSYGPAKIYGYIYKIYGYIYKIYGLKNMICGKNSVPLEFKARTRTKFLERERQFFFWILRCDLRAAFILYLINYRSNLVFLWDHIFINL